MDLKIQHSKDVDSQTDLLFYYDSYKNPTEISIAVFFKFENYMKITSPRITEIILAKKE
jgi:hypothetical protein